LTGSVRSTTSMQKPNNSTTRRRRQWLSTVRRLVSPDFSALSAKLVSRKSSFSFRKSSCHNSRADARIFCRAFTHRSRGLAKEMLAGASSIALEFLFVAFVVLGLLIYLALTLQIPTRRRPVVLDVNVAPKKSFDLPVVLLGVAYVLLGLRIKY